MFIVDRNPRVRPYRQSSGQAAGGGEVRRGGEVMVAASYLGGGNMYFKDIPACLVRCIFYDKSTTIRKDNLATWRRCINGTGV
jgi:hypothetical protein